ncbi:ubiquinol-cytochrome C chaperone [Sphingomonas donggukensis]|uniref:Ubiquinol-cytochrome C chaperone n=1 Tax=Sphingomonas donggukensis TaxID=2949093 RepID=A0ABY4TXE0_9SPHN|nr:ubiquinol-cytochrome C chaperone family protein [Sphingomonas donggukensis]URW77075.1 ubiquinol-cytochrome C chaperone [Sphingomonas donggukensis]
MERLFGRKDEAQALYEAIVARARAAHWYTDGGVADTIDGRFDMIAAILSITLLRIERDPAGDSLGVALAERFVDDMDPQLREIGIGDVVVGKHVGQMMSMLGGRLGAYRDGLAAGSIDTALVRNLYRDQPPAPPALAHVRGALTALSAALQATSIEALAAGQLPA